MTQVREKYQCKLGVETKAIYVFTQTSLHSFIRSVVLKRLLEIIIKELKLFRVMLNGAVLELICY